MSGGAEYRAGPASTDRLPPRKLRWKTRWEGPGGLVAWLFVGFGSFIATMFSLDVLPSVIAVRAFGDTREAEIVAVQPGPAHGKRYQEVRFRHQQGGRSHEGTRVIHADKQGQWPPGIPVEAGERATVSCFSLGPFHGDDLALPRENAAQRREEEIVRWSLFTLGAWVWVLWSFILGIRPVHRERAIFRDGVLVAGKIVRLETIPRGYNKTPIRRVVYSFATLHGPARSATSEARDTGAFARLKIGDIVNVVYDAADPARSQVYEVGAYVFAGAPHPLPPPTVA